MLPFPNIPTSAQSAHSNTPTHPNSTDDASGLGKLMVKAAAGIKNAARNLKNRMEQNTNENPQALLKHNTLAASYQTASRSDT